MQYTNTSTPTPESKSIDQLFRLDGKVAMVTGGAGGIGLEICKAFLEAGANVALIFNANTKALDLIKQISQPFPNQKAKAFKCNVLNKEEVNTVMETVKQEFNGIDILVANAGMTTWESAEESTEESFNQVMNLNVNGSFNCAQAAAKYFKDADKFGNIIFTTSISGHIVNLPQKQASYNASKAALIHLAKSLAIEWSHLCRVNCVSPGYIETEMTKKADPDCLREWLEKIPVKRMCKPHELKGIYVFLASDASSYMTGSDLIVDGGYTLI